MYAPEGSSGLLPHPPLGQDHRIPEDEYCDTFAHIAGMTQHRFQHQAITQTENGMRYIRRTLAAACVFWGHIRLSLCLTVAV